MEPSDSEAPGVETPATHSIESAARSRVRSWRKTDVRIFSSGSDAPRVRRPTDLILFVLAVIAITALSFLAPGPTALDPSIADLSTKIPGLFGGVWEVSYDLLIGWALILLVGAVVAHKRKRLFFDQVLSGALAYGLAAVAGRVAGTGWSSSFSSIGSSDPPAVYPAVRLAVAVAIIVTASPHVSLPLRHFGRWVIGVGAFSCIALGVALPIGVLTGFFVGLGSAALLHLVFGSPGGRLTLAQVGSALRDLDVETAVLDHVPVQPRGVALAIGSTPDGRALLVKIYGRDAREGQLMTSTWQSLWHRGQTPHQSYGRLEQVEHEAFLTLLAERGGVPVLPVVVAGMTPERDALLVIERVGRPLASLESDEIDDRVLRECWAALEKLHDLGVALGRVDGERLFVKPDGSAALGDFGEAMVAAGNSELMADRAQLLVATALAAGEERAVSAATAAVGTEALADVLPFLQPAVLDLETRRAVRDKDWDVGDLRELAAASAGVDPPKLEQVRRITWTSIAMIVVFGLVAYTITATIAQVGLQSLIDELKQASMAWVILALAITPLVQVPQAFSTMGASVRAVRFGPVLMLEYAIQFIALAIPSSAARVALEVRFFERNGVGATGALAIGAIDSLSGFTIEILLLLGITLSGLASLHLSGGISSSSSSSSSSPNWSLLILGGILLVLLAIVVMAIPRYRRRVIAAVRSTAADGRAALRVLRSPSKVCMLFLGNLGAQVLLAGILGICLRAFGQKLPLADLILVNTGVSMFAGFMPVPGGMGVAEAGFTAGLSAFGVPNTIAMSTAILFRLVTFYLPPIWGSFAMKWLRGTPMSDLDPRWSDRDVTGASPVKADTGERRWPMALAVLVAAALQIIQPKRESIPISWLFPALEVSLLIVLLIGDPGRIDRRSPTLRRLTFALIVIMTVGNTAAAVALLVDILASIKGVSAGLLLGRGATIWMTNVIVFSLWYWELDRGGPAERAARSGVAPSFVFAEDTSPEFVSANWMPTYPDYLHLAFTTATAFSPTDTLPVRHWAKMAMMVETIISLVTGILVVARAVNILPGPPSAG